MISYIQNRNDLISHGCVALRRAALDIADYALSAVDPYHTVKELVRLDGEQLLIGDRVFDLPDTGRIYALGAGKATLRIVEALEDILGDRIAGGVIAIKRGQPHDLRYIRVIEASHPFPDLASVQAAKEVLELAGKAQAGDLVFTAITGGSSALLCYPPEDVAFEEKRQLHELLLGCGADIVEINTVRKHVSRVKGGRLAQAAIPAQLINLTVSDVVGDYLDYIAGPVVPDTSCVADAVAVLEKYDLWNQVASSIREHLGKGPAAETPKQLDSELVHSFVVSTSDAAAKAACIRAEESGFPPLLLTTCLEGESREAAIVLASIVHDIISTGNPISAPCAIIASGETTVTLGDDSKGVGGPSQEFALSIATRIDGLDQVAAISIDTDGTDGPTEFAGALVDGQTVSANGSSRRDVFAALRSHMATPLLEKLGDLVYTGATGTNVSDLRVILIGHAEDEEL